MDRENADYAQVVQTLRARYGNIIAPFQLPIGSAENFVGVIDLVEMKAFVGTGKDVECSEIRPTVWRKPSSIANSWSSPQPRATTN